MFARRPVARAPATRPRDRIGRWGFVGLAGAPARSSTPRTSRPRRRRAWRPSAGRARSAAPLRRARRLGRPAPRAAGRPSDRMSRSLRILFLAPQPFFEVRGTPLAVLHMTRALAALGHEVDLLTFPQGEAAPADGVRHRRSLRLPVGRVKAGPSLAKMALDVPFVAEAVARLALRPLRRRARGRGGGAPRRARSRASCACPLVMDVDSSIPDQLRYSGFATRGPAPVARRGARAARAAPLGRGGHRLREPHRRRAGAARPGVPVFQVEDPPLVDRDEPPAAEAVDALRRELGLSAVPVVLYSGNFEPYQGVQLLLEAMAAVPGAQLLLMGGEPARDRAAARARRAARGARRPLRLLRQAPALRAAALPRARRRARLAAGQGREHAVQGLHVPRLRAGRSSPRASPHTRRCSTTRTRSSSRRPPRRSPRACGGRSAAGGGARPGRGRPRARRARVQRRALPREDRRRLRRRRALRHAVTRSTPPGAPARRGSASSTSRGRHRRARDSAC